MYIYMIYLSVLLYISDYVTVKSITSDNNADNVTSVKIKLHVFLAVFS